MPAIPIRPAPSRRCTRKSSIRPNKTLRPARIASSIATSPAARWRRTAARETNMAPDLDASRSRADRFAPLTSEMFSVGQGHEVYVESGGREGGIPAVYLHGGPGGGGLSEDFLSVLPPEERTSPVQAYFRRILDADPKIHGPAARAWGDTERILSEHSPNRARLDLKALHSSHAMPATPFMEAHYFANG